MTGKQAIKELRRLSKPRQFAVKLYGKHRAYINVEWDLDVKLSFSEIGLDCSGRSISLEKFQSELAKWEDDIEKCCDEIDDLARKAGFKNSRERIVYFDKLFLLAGDIEFESKFGKGVCCVFH